MLIAPRGTQERQVLYGPAKAGKSSCWADIIYTMVSEGNTAQHYVVDMDNTWSKMLHWMDEAGVRWDYRSVKDIGNKPIPRDQHVTVYEPRDIHHYIAACKEIGTEAEREDWAYADLMDWPWNEAQEEYISQVYEVDPETYYLNMRAEVHKIKRDSKGKKGSAKEYGGHEGKDWPWITRLYRRGWKYFKGGRFNWVAVAPEGTLSDQWATAEQIAQYKAVGGAKPEGQKRLAHDCDSLFRVTKRASGLREVKMVGDRGREHIWEEMETRTVKLGNVLDDEGYAQKYLVEVAGWERQANQRDARRRVGSRSSSAPGTLSTGSVRQPSMTPSTSQPTKRSSSTSRQRTVKPTDSTSTPSESTMRRRKVGE